VDAVSERFPKARRLLKRREFLAVQRGGAGVRSRHFVVLLRFRDDQEPCRLGVVASKRVGNAVARNRGKRRVREWFRTSRNMPQGADLVVILRAGSVDLPHPDLCRELDEASGRALRKARKSLERTRASGRSTAAEETPARGKGRGRG
jgi:ribonuclease P protein component